MNKRELDEAAEEHIQSVVDAAGHPGWDWETQDIAEAFKAGAEWQREQMMDEWLKDRDGCFWDGVEEGKKAMEKQMLEEAMEGFIKRDIGGQLILGGIGAGVDEFILLDSLAFPEIHTGEYYPVKVIIVKEDDK